MGHMLRYFRNYGTPTVLGVVFLAILTGCPPKTTSDPKFSIILLDYREGAGYAVNEKGEVAGELNYKSREAVIWQPNHSPKVQKLGSLGADKSTGLDINNYSEVCGIAQSADYVPRAFRWTQAGGMEELYLEPFRSGAYGINDRGEIVGKADGPSGERAFIWRQGDGLASVPGADYNTYAEAINEFSNIVGNHKGDPQANSPDEGRVWRGDTDPYLIENTLGEGDLQVSDMNDTLTVVGWAEDEEYKRVAIQWTKAKGISALDHLGWQTGFEGIPGPWVSEAKAINFYGDIVGSAASSENINAAVLWRDGKIYDLNKLIPKGTGWTSLTTAYDINNKGCIVGEGLRGAYKMYAFLLVPVVLYSVSLTPMAVIGGQPVAVQVVLDGDAPFDLDIEAKLIGFSRAVQLQSPVAVVRENTRSVEFTIETQPVDTEETGELEVSFGGNSLTAVLIAMPR